jgi:hypothetical protein
VDTRFDRCKSDLKVIKRGAKAVAVTCSGVLSAANERQPEFMRFSDTAAE